jgi:hypothetical protein
VLAQLDELEAVNEPCKAADVNGTNRKLIESD